MFGAGAISTTFWWRRWIEQSPLEQVHDVALGVSQDLHLDVAGAHHGLLDEHRRIAESALRLAHRRAERLGQLVGRVDAAHAATTATGDSLHEDREADLVGTGDEGVDVAAGRGGFQSGYAGRAGRGQRRDLVAGHLEHLRGRADECQSVLRTCLGEVGVLRQEAISGIDGVGAGLLGDADDLVDVEIGADRVAFLADLVSLVRLDAVFGIAILAREHRNGSGPQLGGGAEGTDGDLATVGDQNFGEHGGHFSDARSEAAHVFHPEAGRD